MTRSSPQKDWFFPIDEAPVLATVTQHGLSRHVRVPHKKALVAADTGDIVGIVGAGYKGFTNQKPWERADQTTLDADLETRLGRYFRDLGANALFPSSFSPLPSSFPSPRLRRDRPTLERRAGAWLRDFTVAAAKPGFSVASHFGGAGWTEIAGPQRWRVIPQAGHFGKPRSIAGHRGR